MSVNPIIPIWLMVIICIVLLIFKRKGAFNYIRQIIIVLLLFMINLRIMIPDPDAETVQKKVNVLFVVDNTISMQAEDYGHDKEPRMNAVRRDCAYIMEQLPGAQFSIISFADTEQLLTPYTIDTANITQSLNSLTGQPTLYARGTGFEGILNYLENHLNDDSDNLQIVFFISDGELTNEREIMFHPGLKQYIDGGAVLGYGTDEGGAMHAFAFFGDEDPEELYYYDDNFDQQPALSYIDEENLETLADDMGISYVHMTSQDKMDSVISDVLKQMQAAGDDMVKDTIAGYSDTFFYLLIPFIPLLVFDFIYYKRKVTF